MEWITARVTAIPIGRGPKLGEGTGRASRSQPPDQRGSQSLHIGVEAFAQHHAVIGDLHAQPGHAVAHLA